VSAAAINGRSRGTIGTLHIRFSGDARRFASEPARGLINRRATWIRRRPCLSMTRARDSDPESHLRFTNERWTSIRMSEYLDNISRPKENAARCRNRTPGAEKNGGHGNVNHVDHVRVNRYRTAHCTFGRLLSLLVPVARCTTTRPPRLNNNGIILKVSGIIRRNERIRDL
jgi:hypothetical protein